MIFLFLIIYSPFHIENFKLTWIFEPITYLVIFKGWYTNFLYKKGIIIAFIV
jgi:hypothetical protein